MRLERKEAKGDYVFCLGKSRSFSLHREGANPRYKVDGIGADKQEQINYDEAFGNYFIAPFGVYDKVLRESMREPWFKIDKAQTVQFEGRTCLEIQYENPEFQRREQVTLDPESNWIIRHCEVQYFRRPDPKLSTYTCSITYGQATDGIPIPSLVKFSSSRFVKSCEFETFLFEPTSDAEFTLAHYGLPDIALSQSGVSRNRTSLFLWLLLAAGGLLVAALGLRRFAKRMEPKPGS